MIVETASHTSQVRGLISFLNSLSPHPVGSCVSGDKAYKGLSRLSELSGRDGENMEKLSSCGFSTSGGHMCRLPHTVHRFLPQDTAYCAPAALHVTFDRFIACAWVASVLHVLAITCR